MIIEVPCLELQTGKTLYPYAILFSELNHSDIDLVFPENTLPAGVTSIKMELTDGKQ